MSKGKKKKHNIKKRKQRAGQKKKLKRKLKLVKLKKEEKQISAPHRPALSDIKPPEGFRTIPMGKAMMEYARPLMEKAESEEDLPKVHQAAMVLWNFSLAIQKGETNSGLTRMEKEILTALKVGLKIDRSAARDILEMMVERYGYLFPDDIQPDGAPFMFIRKEVAYLILPIEEDRLELSPDPVALDEPEKLLFSDLHRLDVLVDQEVDWDDMEELLSSIKDPFADAFANWLVAKGIDAGLASELADCLFIWFDFIYAYEHSEETRLASIPVSSWLEFFHDFLLRKLMIDPPSYVFWPPAIKLFYRYLGEREYLGNARKTVELVQAIEPGFYEHLDEQFG